MNPTQPIIPGQSLPVTVFAKNQSQYKELPAFYWEDDGTVLTRWRLSWRERLIALWRGDVYLWVKTFGKPLQPLHLQVERPQCSETTIQVHEPAKECAGASNAAL